jgi:hypothetical protein
MAQQLMFQNPKALALIALSAALTFSVACNSSKSTGDTTSQTKAAEQQPKEDVRTRWFNPEKEADKLGVKFYPGSKVYYAQPPFQRGNGTVQQTYFTTPDGKDAVAQFYGSEYKVEFRPNDKGHPFALINDIEPKDVYTFELLDGLNGNTDIHVTRIHSCDNMFPQPCDQKTGSEAN